MTFIQIPIDEVKSLAKQCLLKKGATEREAQMVIDDYLDADLRGRASHGFVSFSVALSAFPHEGTYQVVENTGSVVRVEGNGDCGHVVARDAIDLALKNLSEYKVAAVGLRNITRFNCPGGLARYGAQRGAITMVLEYGGKNFMVPYGGTQAALSTNPIGIAIPGTDPMFVLDIATSERAIGYVGLAKLAGEAIPETWGVARSGQSTTDPSQVMAVKPFGGYKGYALSLALEILSGALVQVPIGTQGSLPKRGALILLLDPTLYGHTMQSFSEQVMTFLGEVTAVTSSGSHPVTYPGQLAEKRRAQQLAAGKISLPESVVQQMREMSGAVSV